MRARRPYLFSDSTTTTKRAVTREVLSYHLETLTNQKDEATFEKFAHRMAEKFVAPNLRPQTGPSGGGDGKTDAETYPVAKSIALRWYVPDSAPAHERWAFAFSAKKKWNEKVRSDVANIVDTGRGYPGIYFVTNQYVPSKDSAAVQDALQKKHGIPVTILDRTWILDRVFNHDSLDSAIEILGVGAGTEHQVEITGPEDLKRLAELGDLERAIGDGTRYAGTHHALIEDCHRAALLARCLEKPRAEVDGRFFRAVRLAREHDFPKLELSAVYDWAWTSFFWFDDFATLNALYDEVEKLAIDSDTADDLERLSNLLTLLRNSVASGVLTSDTAKLEIRNSGLVVVLTKLRADTSRPNNALHAHTLLLLNQLEERLHKEKAKFETDLSDLWDEFRSVIEASDGLGTFPFEQIADLLTEIGAFIPESPAFDLLYEILTDKMAARRSEGEAAQRNSTRGFQKLDKGLPYEAIRWLGRAVSLLVKEEYGDELVKALIGSSIAYEQGGLPWAARNYALAAVAHQFGAFRRTGSIADVNPATLSRLFATEIQLGRVPYVLSAYHLGMMVTNARATTEQQRKNLSEKQLAQSAWLAALLLKTPFAQLARVKSLPDALERLGLHHSRIALLFLMGREDVLRAEGSVPQEETQEGYLEFFEQMAAFGRNMILPERPDYLIGDRANLHSRVLGCEIRISCANNLISIAIGEAVLGTLEALLATSLNHRILPHLDQLHLRVEPTEASELRPALNFIEEDGRTVGIITHVAHMVCRTRDEVLCFPNWLRESIFEIFMQFASPVDYKKWAESVLKEENGYSRAVTFSNTPSAMNLIYGTDYERLSIGEWIQDGDIPYEVTRRAEWRPVPEQEQTKAKSLPTFSEQEPPEELVDPESLKHTDVRIISPIDVRKWNDAKWRAALFMTVPDAEDLPPVLGLAFLNEVPAAAIFRGLCGRFGRDDADNMLRIAVVRSVRSSNPHAYAVIIGPNADSLPLDGAKTFEFVSRIQVMTPSSSENLNRFLAEYNRHGRYLLAPAHLPRMNDMPKPMMEFALGKYHLTVREAWEIGINDPDTVALDPDDPPMVPPDQPNAPVLRAIGRLRAMERRTSRR